MIAIVLLHKITNCVEQALRESLNDGGIACVGLREHPQLIERGFWETVTHPDAGTHSYPGPVAKFRETPLHIRTPAPSLGQHNEEILRGLLGIDEQRYQRLLDAQVIGTVYTAAAT